MTDIWDAREKQPTYLTSTNRTYSYQVIYGHKHEYYARFKISDLSMQPKWYLHNDDENCTSNVHHGMSNFSFLMESNKCCSVKNAAAAAYVIVFTLWSVDVVKRLQM